MAKKTRAVHAVTMLRSTEVAAQLGISDEQVRRYCELGKFPNAWRAGLCAHWRVPAADVATFLARNRVVVVRQKSATASKT